MCASPTGRWMGCSTSQFSAASIFNFNIMRCWSIYPTSLSCVLAGFIRIMIVMMAGRKVARETQICAPPSRTRELRRAKNSSFSDSSPWDIYVGKSPIRVNGCLTVFRDASVTGGTVLHLQRGLKRAYFIWAGERAIRRYGICYTSGLNYKCGGGRWFQRSRSEIVWKSQ